MKTSEAAAKRAQGLTGGMYGDEGENPFAATVEKAIRQIGGSIKLLDFDANAGGILIPDDASDEQIDRLKAILFAMWDSLQIYIGDLLVALDNRQRGETKEIAEQFHRDPETLYKWKRICKAVSTPLRRGVSDAVPDAKKPLTISHYEMVERLSPDRQEELLTDALKNGWSVDRLRKAAGMIRFPLPRQYAETDPAHPENGKRHKRIQRLVKEERYVEIDLGEIALSIDWLEDIRDRVIKAQKK